jgi:hypothetical protein
LVWKKSSRCLLQLIVVRSAAPEDTSSSSDNYSHVQFIFSFILMPGKDGGGGQADSRAQAQASALRGAPRALGPLLPKLTSPLSQLTLPSFCLCHHITASDQLAIVTANTAPPTIPRPACLRTSVLLAAAAPSIRLRPQRPRTHTHHFRPPSNELSETLCNRPRAQLLARQQHHLSRVSLSFNPFHNCLSADCSLSARSSHISTTSLAAHTVALGPQMGSLHPLSLDVRPCS